MVRLRVAGSDPALPVVRRSRIPIAMAGLVAVTAVIVVIARAASSSSARPGRGGRVAEGYVRPLPPPVTGAFKTGGVPERDEALEALLVDDFTGFVIETDVQRGRGGRLAEHKRHAAALDRATPIAAHGPALAAVWSDLVSALGSWVYVPNGRELDAAARELRAKVRVVSDHLAAAGVGIYLEGDVLTQAGVAHAIIYSYRVERVVFVVAGGEPRRVLSLRRLDHLNLTHSLLGMQSEELGDPVLLLDQIDEHVTTTLLPLLAVDAPYPLTDDGDGAELVALARAVGQVVRREVAAALGPDAATATELGGLLVARGRIVDAWRGELEHRHWSMPPTSGMFLPPALLDQLAPLARAPELAQVREIEAELQRIGAVAVAARCHDLVAATVRRHEAQHGLDDDRAGAGPLRYPAALEAMLGDELDRDGMPRRSVERTRAELAAYLSQIANDPVTPQLSLWHLARNVFHRERWGTAESYAGVVILEGLGRQLHVAATGPVIHDGKIDRLRLLPIATAVVAVSDAQLRAAVDALWRELYDEPLVAIVDN